jgi:hypothetical protein
MGYKDVVILDTHSAKNRLFMIYDMTPCEAVAWITAVNPKSQRNLNIPIRVSDTGYDTRDLVQTGRSYAAAYTRVLAYDVVACCYCAFPVLSATVARGIKKAFEENMSIIFRPETSNTPLVSRVSIAFGKSIDLPNVEPMKLSDTFYDPSRLLSVSDIFGDFVESKSHRYTRELLNSLPAAIKYILIKTWVKQVGAEYDSGS